MLTRKQDASGRPQQAVTQQSQSVSNDFSNTTLTAAYNIEVQGRLKNYNTTIGQKVWVYYNHWLKFLYKTTVAKNQ